MEPEDRTAADVARRTGLDHVAHPSFDAAATHRFYTEVMGAELEVAATGDSEEWKAPYLLAAYRLEGVELDFFSFAGIVRPQPDGLPDDIRHAGIAVASAADVARVRERLDRHAVAYWVERHDGDDGEHLYVRDPNGLVLEFSVAAPPHPARADALELVRRWIGTHAAAP